MQVAGEQSRHGALREARQVGRRLLWAGVQVPRPGDWRPGRRQEVFGERRRPPHQEDRAA